MTQAHAVAPLAVVASHDLDPPRVSRTEARAHQLAEPERRSLSLLEGSEGLAAWVGESIGSLVGDDRDAVRLRTIAAALATERARQVALQELLDQLICARDLDAIRAIDRVLTSTTKRIAILTSEHRACCTATAGRRDVVVAVAHADSVNFGSSRK